MFPQPSFNPSFPCQISDYSSKRPLAGTVSAKDLKNEIDTVWGVSPRQLDS